MKIKILSLCICLVSSVSYQLNAAEQNDTTLNKSVTVTREFKPQIEKRNKVLSKPNEAKVNVVKDVPAYSTVIAPMIADVNVQTIVPKELKHLRNYAKKGFARVGIGNPINSIADFMYPILDDSINRFDVSLKHLGAFADKKHSNSAMKLEYTHIFKSVDLYAKIGGMHDFFNYYGNSFSNVAPISLKDLVTQYPSVTYNTPDNRTLTIAEIDEWDNTENHLRFNGVVGVRSEPLSDDFRFDVNLNYNFFKAINADNIENRLHLDADFDVPANENRLGMKFEINQLNYSSSNYLKSLNDTTNIIIKIAPFYKLIGDNWFVKLGAKVGVSIGNNGQMFTPSPDVAAEWKAIPEYFALYGGVTGNLKINSLYETNLENRYLAPQNRLENTYTPINAYLGANITPINNFMINVFGQYQIISNQYFYVNRQYSQAIQTANIPKEYSNIAGNRFDVVYDDNVGKLTFGTQIIYDYKDQINLYIKARYNSWKLQNQNRAWQMPTMEMKFGANIKLRNDIALNTQFLYQDGRYALLGDKNEYKMRPIYDLNIGANYTYNQYFTLFLNANNLFNSKYEIYSGYQVQGVNLMVGASISF